MNHCDALHSDQSMLTRNSIEVFRRHILRNGGIQEWWLENAVCTRSILRRDFIMRDITMMKETVQPLDRQFDGSVQSITFNSF
jgi:hypothetical protein